MRPAPADLGQASPQPIDTTTCANWCLYSTVLIGSVSLQVVITVYMHELPGVVLHLHCSAFTFGDARFCLLLTIEVLSPLVPEVHYT